MTVGIGAISRADDKPGLVMAADRMVTLRSQIEYEDTDSKLEIISEAGPLTAAAIGSGSLSLIDDILDRLDRLIIEQTPTDMEDLMVLVRDAYQNMVKEAINNNILYAFDLEIQDLHDEGTDLADGVEERVLNDIASYRKKIRENVSILFGGVAGGECSLYTLDCPDYTNYTNSGYAVIGSGTRSAQSLFIRNRYDPDGSDIIDSVFSVGEAKVQAEERRGVGFEMDMATITEEGGVRQFEQEEGLKEEIEKIKSRQNEIRENIIAEWRED